MLISMFVQFQPEGQVLGRLFSSLWNSFLSNACISMLIYLETFYMKLFCNQKTQSPSLFFRSQRNFCSFLCSFRRIFFKLLSRTIISCIIGDNYISCIIEESGLVGLRHYNWSWTVTGSNPIRCTRSAGLSDSVLLQGFQWPLGQNCTNAVIKVGWVKSTLLCLLFCLQFGCFIYFYCAFCLASVFAPAKKVIK